MHHPFHELLKWAGEHGRQAKKGDARQLILRKGLQVSFLKLSIFLTSLNLRLRK